MTMSIGGVSGQLAGGILSNTKLENAWISKAPPEMQKTQELVQMITQMMKTMHEMSMSIIRNIGG
jgi:hypothetical protein